VKHAGYSKEAKEIIKIIRRGVHSARKAVIESFSIETCYLIVLPAMIADDLAAFGTKQGKVVWPCSDIRRIERLRHDSVLGRESSSVPLRIVIDHVSKPVLSKLTLARQRPIGK